MGTNKPEWAGLDFLRLMESSSILESVSRFVGKLLTAVPCIMDLTVFRVANLSQINLVPVILRFLRSTVDRKTVIEAQITDGKVESISEVLKGSCMSLVDKRRSETCVKEI